MCERGIVSLIEQAKGWIRGDGVPQPIAGLMDPIDADYLAKELRLSPRGQENGKHERPSTESATLDSVEEEIVGHIMAE